MLHILTSTNDGINVGSMLQRMACGDPSAVQECSRVHGPLIWTWAKKFTDSTHAAEAATLEILSDIRDSAKSYDAANCSEITYVKQICIRRLMGVTAG